MILDVLAAESAALVAGLPPDRWSRPTRCDPWDVRELLAHVRVAVGRVTAMLAAPAPPAATVSAADYYRPDARFSAATNADRVATARSAVAGDELAAFTATVSQVVAACRAEPPGRVVRTRHGDPMLLDDFLTTRVVEVAVHGFDLADAAGVPSWLTPAAAGTLQDLLLGPGRRAPDPAHFLRAATGRASDPELLARLSPRLLALG
ncbi:maleylpyruvate isomerase N-terminal domain-containing protein [Actinoplanes sp. NPDC051411]|uniref:maleylpyruvate isomerase N-terminal domain-containing protein n=1 Tax=Actinoplanes sp. NPDC051411 TaxID=3155522 RepID=UPI0034282FBF